MKISAIFALLYIHLSLSWAQAPGDEDRRCTVDHTSPATYPDTERNLMDSYNYQDLLPGNGTGNTPIATAVWNDYSFDGNDDPSNIISQTYWQQGAGGICRFQSKVCGWRRQGIRQNNWLFTQHIRQDFDSNTYNYNVSIHVWTTYSVQSCRIRLGCRQGFNLSHYMTNSAQLPSLSESGFMNTNNYQKFAEPYAARSLVTYTNTYTFTLPPSSTGFYIAAQDTGSCATISRLRVYRNNCKSRQLGLVLYPDAPAPVSNSENIDVSCVENAVVSGSAVATCASDGTWGPERHVCQCQLGHEQRQSLCIACPAGQYRSSRDTTCQQCPANTVMNQEAAPECRCLNEHFRNDESDPVTRQYENPTDETPNYDCTMPPSAPQNVLLPVTNTSITVSWSPPAEDGGRTDIYYEVKHSNPLSIGEFYEPIYLPKTTTKYKFPGLRPFTDYCVRVTSHNGVSDQDPDGTHLRTIEVCGRTDEGRAGAIEDLQCFDRVVVWEQPSRPNGIITGYQVTVTEPDRTGFQIEQSFLVMDKEKTPQLPELSGTLNIEVVAVNGWGPGETTCKLRVNLQDSSNPQCALYGCNECPEKREGLVNYPKTTVSEEGGSVVTVTTECVENAELASPSLEVTCSSGGIWGSEHPEPECKCTDNFKVTEAGTSCVDSRKCSNCVENVTAGVTIDCNGLVLTWSPVDGAQLYSVRLREKGADVGNVTVRVPVYRTSLSSDKIKDKEISLEVGVLLDKSGVKNYSAPVIVNTNELAGYCGCSTGEELSEKLTTTQFSVGVAVTFVVTGLAVFFLTCIICLMVGSYKRKKYNFKASTTNTDYFDSPMEEKGKYI